MSAIYQRARPSTFSQVIGQEHVTGILAAAVEQGRTGHAYLLSGPRGVGKTSTARLLAAAINCEAATGRPCGECESCLLVRAGTHPDVIELDAASNNSVEDIRDIREKVGLSSLRGGHRVWILDEAHMLSRAAANALLKTLEEPPPRLMFVLATTEPEKLPPTVLSRCQHYRFRRLSEDEINGKLQELAASAGVTAEAGALELVARAAEGAMRDAESLLERLIAPGEGITLPAVTAALGLPPAERLESLARAVAGSDLKEAFSVAAGLYRDGFAPRTLAERLGMTLRDSLHRLLQGQEAGHQLDQAGLVRLITVLDEEQDRFVRRDDLYSLEVSLIKAVSALQAPAAPAETRQAAPPLPDFDPVAPPPRQQRTPAPKRTTAAAAPAQQPAAAAAPTASGSARRVSLHDLRQAAPGQLKAFLMPAQDSFEGDTLTLSYDERSRFHFTQLSNRRAELEALVTKVGGEGITVVLEGPGGGSPKKR